MMYFRGMHLCIAVSAVSLLAVGCSSASFLDSIGINSEKDAAQEQKEEEETKTAIELTANSGEGLIGTWINNDYNNRKRSAMVVYEESSDGNLVYAAYDNADGSGDSYEGVIEITEMWTDSEGRTNIKSVVSLTGGMSWDTLTRISGDGSMLEVQSGTETIDPNGPQYSIYYRR